jgi:hypothetical protein
MGWRERGRPHGRWAYGAFFNGFKTGHYGWFRNIRTTQEMRFWDEEFCRRKRSPTQLPNAWWDIHRTAQRSWKEHRKTQWKHRGAA